MSKARASRVPEQKEGDFVPQYEVTSLQNVMQFFADNFKGDAVQKRFDGSTQADWWVDVSKGQVLFRLWVKKS